MTDFDEGRERKPYGGDPKADRQQEERAPVQEQFKRVLQFPQPKQSAA